MSEIDAALSKSGLIWVEVDGRGWPVWHVVVDGTAYVVSGPGEQTLPELPGDVHVVLRAKDSRAKVARLPATVRRVATGDSDWEPATTALKASRLNAPEGDTVARWAADNVVWALTIDTAAALVPPAVDEPSGATAPAQVGARTDTWRPAHLGGRRRRTTRRTTD